MLKDRRLFPGRGNWETTPRIIPTHLWKRSICGAGLPGPSVCTSAPPLNSECNLFSQVVLPFSLSPQVRTCLLLPSSLTLRKHPTNPCARTVPVYSTEAKKMFNRHILDLTTSKPKGTWRSFHRSPYPCFKVAGETHGAGIRILGAAGTQGPVTITLEL